MIKLILPFLLITQSPVEVPTENAGPYYLSGYGMYCDADADTYYICLTDDTCSYYVNGAVDFRMTANQYSALDGSSFACYGPATDQITYYDDLGMAGGTRSTDANAQDMSISAENVYPWALAGRTPGNLVMRGGVDSSYISCGAAVCAGADTVTVTRTIGSAAAVVDVLTYGVSYCVGGCLTNIAMANSLGTAMDALSGVDVLVDDVVAGGIVGIIYPKGTMDITVTDSNVNPNCTIITTGTQGHIVVPSGTVGTPGVSMLGDPDTGWYSAGANIPALSAGGVYQFYCTAIGNICYARNFISEGYLALAAGSYLSWDARARIYSNADGKINIQNAAGTSGMCLDFSTDGSITWYARDCTTMKFYMGSNGSFDQIGYKSTQSTDAPTYQELACAGGGGSATLVTTGNKLCDGCKINHVGYRIITAGLTGPTSMDVGIAGIPDLFCDDCAVADNTTVKNSSWTANLPQPILANDEILFTMNGGNCTAGTVRAEIWYRTITASSTD